MFCLCANLTVQQQCPGSIYEGIQDQIDLDNKTFVCRMHGKSYPIVNASVDANNLVMSRYGHRFLHYQDNVNLVPHVYNITKWTGRDSMQLLMMRCASLRLGKRDIEDFGPHTLEASRISTEDSSSTTIIIMSPASSIPDRLPHLKREPSPRCGLSLIDDDASRHQPHVSFPLIMTLRDNYTEFPRYLLALLRRPCTATASNREIGKISLGPDRPALLSRPATSRTWDTRQHQSSRFSSIVVDNLRQPSPRNIVVTHASISRWNVRLPARLTRKERQEIAS